MTAPIERHAGFGAPALDEGAAEARFAAIGQQLSGVMHDLTSPLTVASGYVQLMARESSEERRQAYLGRVLRQFDEIASMSRELLAFARGEQRARPAPVLLTQLALEWEEMLALELAGHAVRVTVAVEGEGEPLVEAGTLRRIVSNLARNGAEAMSASGALVVRLGIRDQRLLLCCDDSGPGVPEGMRAQVFQAGFSTRSGPGRGLGLALVRQLTVSLGGTITVGESPLGGARFEVSLPLVSAT